MADAPKDPHLRPRPSNPPPGWHREGDLWRWWDGERWSGHTSPGTSPAEETRPDSTLTFFGIMCAIVAVFFLPVIIGPLGMILGGIGVSRGERGASVAIILALFGTVFGFMLGAAAVADL